MTTSVTSADLNPQTPTSWRMPAEWAPHERCLMAWPTRESLWNGHFAAAKAEYAAVANAISAYEPVLMVVNPGQADEVRVACTGAVEIVELPIDDSWIRDSGPQIVLDGRGGRAGVDFRFNSWGERFLPYDKDAAVTEGVLDHLGIGRLPREMVLEGGSITVDGEGTLITTEQCLLNPNRNPGWTRDRIEAELKEQLGVRVVVWLPYGHFDDDHTDGHVDGVCTYVRPGTVIAQTCEDPASPDYKRMRANLEVLRSTTDAVGRPLEIIELPQYPSRRLADGTEVMAAYANFYVANGGVVVPVAEHPLDESGLKTIAAAFPEREVVGVPANIIAFGGGGVHCITQQVPTTGADTGRGVR